MKHKMNSLVLAFLFALPFSAQAFVLSGDLPQDGVVINNVVIDKSQTDLKNEHYICLGAG